MMEKLLEEVSVSVENEYARASTKFGATNHSDHESYAVLAEEYEEALVEVKSTGYELANFWSLVKSDNGDSDKLNCLKDLERRATLAACELIQVAAMARKANATVSDRTVFVDLTREGDPF